VYGFNDVSYFISKHPEGPAQMFGWVETPKPSPRALALDCGKNLIPGGLPRGFAMGFYCPKTCPKLRQGVVPRGYSTLLMFFTQISKSRYIGICSPGQEPCSTEI